jgi:hypothetical protein
MSTRQDGGLSEQRKTEKVPMPGKDTKFQWPSWTGVAQGPFCLGLISSYILTKKRLVLYRTPNLNTER